MISQSITYACDAPDCKETNMDIHELMIGNRAYYPYLPVGWITITHEGSQKMYCDKHVQKLLEAAKA